MTASYSANRRQRITTAVGVLLVAAGCASRPSLGPTTDTGNPAHVDGGTGQLLRYCETLHDKGKLPMAAAMCERAYQLDPSNADPLLELASIMGDMGEIDMAKKAYQTILRDHPDHAEAHYGLGRIHMNAKEYDLALAEFQAGLRSNPNDPRLYNAAGVASGMLGAHAAAQEAFKAGLEVAPNDVHLRNNLGLSLIQTGQYDKGLSMLQAVAKNPGAGEASRENLNLALSVVTAARAEALLAESRTHMEAKAQAESDAQQQASAMDEPETGMANREAAMAGATDMPMDMSTDMPAKMAEDDAQSEADIAMAEEPAPAATQEITEPTPLISTAIAESPSAAKGAPPAPATEHGNRPEMTDPPARLAANRPGAEQMASAAQPKDETAAKISDDSAAKGKDQATAPMAKDKVAATRKEPDTAMPGADDHAVQLASYTSEDRAWSGWSMIQADAADILGDVKPTVRAADLGSDIGKVYRLRTAPAPKAQAQHLCDALKARGIACLVVKTEAEPVEQGGTEKRRTL